MKMKSTTNTATTIIALAFVGLVIMPLTTTFSVLPQANKMAIQQRPRTETRLFVATTPSIKAEKLTKEAEELLEVLEAKANGDADRFGLVVAQVAPSVRVAIPEEVGMEPGSLLNGKLVAALKKLGFDIVLDTNTAADLTICEEGTELLHRLQARVNNNQEDAKFGEGDPGPELMPLFTSCCPGWMNMVEKTAPELAPYVSTCKSPHMMYGAFLKEYSEEILGQPADKVYFTSVMPCVRKRGESDRAAFEHNGIRDIDNVITTKDLGQLLRLKGIDMAELEPVKFDSPFEIDGTGSGAGQLFGATGGVMEAAVRSVYELVTGKELPMLELDEVRGLDGIKEAVIPLHDEDNTIGLPVDLRVAVVNGLGNAKILIKKIEAGEVQYDFVEVMACPGGCIGGGGQPKAGKGACEKRLQSIYVLDRSLPIRRSHENPNVKKMYEDYLGEYGGEKAHALLHVKPVYGESPPPKKK
jgi:iron-only hydrogenase group A